MFKSVGKIISVSISIMTFPDRSPWTGRDREAGTSKNINQQEMNRWAWRRLKVCYVCIKVYLFPPRIELGTFCVLGRRDNRYTTETCYAATPVENKTILPITQTIVWNIQSREQNFLSVFVCMFGVMVVTLTLSLFLTHSLSSKLIFLPEIGDLHRVQVHR